MPLTVIKLNDLGLTTTSYFKEPYGSIMPYMTTTLVVSGVFQPFASILLDAFRLIPNSAYHCLQAWCCNSTPSGPYRSCRLKPRSPRPDLARGPSGHKFASAFTEDDRIPEPAPSGPRPRPPQERPHRHRDVGGLRRPGSVSIGAGLSPVDHEATSREVNRS